jgi:hypothetical protein
VLHLSLHYRYSRSDSWGENDQTSQIAGGTNESTSYQYATAGTYDLIICQNSYCDDFLDLDVTGAATVEAKNCDGCS